MKKSTLTAVAACCLIVLVAADSYAQFGGGVFGGGRSSRGRSGGYGGESGGGGQREGRPGPQSTPNDALSYEVIEYRLNLLEEDLKLADPQRKAWQAFADKARAYASDIARERARDMRSAESGTQTPSGLQHVRQAVDDARNRAEALESIESATVQLYQALTPEQKTLADMRIPTFVAPRNTRPAQGGNRPDLPDLGGHGRNTRQ